MKAVLPRLVAMGVLAIAGFRLEAAALMAVRSSREPGSARVVLKLDRPVRYQHGLLKNPDRLYVDLLETRSALLQAPMEPEPSLAGTLLMGIRIGGKQERTTRVVFDLSEPVEYSLAPSKDSSQLIVTISKRTELLTMRPAKARADVVPPRSEVPSRLETTARPLELRAVGATLEQPAPPAFAADAPELPSVPPKRAAIAAVAMSPRILLPAAFQTQAAGSLRGRVLDPSGAAIPKASISVTGLNRAVRAAESDNTGNYTVPGLPSGECTVRVSAAGFGIYQRTVIVDSPGSAASTLDVQLAIATEQQKVTVSDEQQVSVDPASNAGATVLTGAQLDSLSDDPDQMQADLLALAGPASGPSGGQIFVDGFSGGRLPPKGSIREVRVNSNPFSAEFDRPGRGRVEIFTKPGTDKFHGSAQINYGNALFNARNPFSDNKPDYNSRNWYANLSGPLSKKGSFFLDFSRRDSTDAALINAQIIDPQTFQVQKIGQSVPVPFSLTTVSPRLDYQFTPNIALQARYSWAQNDASNQGVGGTNLLNTAYSTRSTDHTVQLLETWVINAHAINETRFQYFRDGQNQVGSNPVLNIQVNDEFSSGSRFPLQYLKNDSYELQNYTSMTHGSQFFRFGLRMRAKVLDSYATSNYPGRFVFDSLGAYAIGLQGVAQGLTAAQIIANGGGPSQYIVAGGNPQAKVHQIDAGLFLQDDWRVRPNVTLSLGLRYETQSNIADHRDWAPRIGVAWGIGKGQTAKTVLRAGYGWFYDRFPVDNVLQAARYNGINQQQYVVTNPSFYPVPPPASGLSGFTQSQNTYIVDDHLRAPVIEQSAIGLDRQLFKKVSLSVIYLHSQGLHQDRVVNINTPYPGTYQGPGTGVYPYGASAGVLDLYSGSGNYKQDHLVTTFNTRIRSFMALWGWYAYGRQYTDVIGSPSNPYNFHADWGRAPFDIRHSGNLGALTGLPLGLRLYPSVTINSAPPFNITQGVDQLGSTFFNARPAFVPAGFTGPACTAQLAASRTTCIVSTASYGSFLINPGPGMQIIPADYGIGFAQLDVSARLSRTWGWGEQGAGGGGAGRGGFRSFFGGGDGSAKKYTVTLALYARNALNTVNAAPPQGNLLSPRFGQALALAGGGSANQSANRSLDLSLRFGF